MFLIEAIQGLVEATVAAISSAIEAVANLFTAAGESTGAGEAIVLLSLLILESIAWFVLFVFEILRSVFSWRKPKKVKKPVIWRKLKQNHEEVEKPS